MDSTNTTSLLNYADAQLKSKNSKGYAESIDKALKIDPENSEALGAKGYYLCIYQRKNHDGASFLNKAIKINHYNQSAHHLLGRGYTPANYSEKPVFDQDLLIVDSLLKNNQFEKASEQIQKRYLKDSKNPEVLKLLAAVEFHLGNYHKCIAYSFDLLRIKPNFGLAHFYISSSLFKLKNEHNVLIKKFNKDFNQKTVPDEIPFLKDVFINYNQCDDDLKKIIRLSVLPFCGFLEALKISGATVYFMDFHHQLWNCPYLENTQGTRSVDLRLVDDLGGQGGYHMTSEKFQQSEVMHGRYNVAFHEFAHLIHWLFTPEQLKELKQLFISAKKGGYTLDWYADLNEREYFAQGVEAYLSEQKLPGQSDAYRNTKSDLLKKDIHLFNFIESLINPKSYQENIVQAYILNSQNIYSYDEAIDVLKKALILFPNHPDLLIELGKLYRLNSEFDKSLKIHKDALRIYPENIRVVISLADNLFQQNNSVAQSIEILDSMQKKFENNAEILSHLGYYYFVKGNYELAIKSLKRAIELDPYPDPYNQETKDCFYFLGKCMQLTSDYIEAEVYLQKSLDINSNNAEASAELALVKFNLNKFEEAKRFLARALELNPGNKRVLEIKRILLIK